MTEDRVLWHLDNWAYWQRERKRSELDDPQRGMYPSRASGPIGRSHSSDLDTMCDMVDRRCADAVDAIVWKDCTPLERQAVTHKHFAAVFRFPRLGFTVEAAYKEALGKIGRGLDRRGIV